MKNYVEFKEEVAKIKTQYPLAIAATGALILLVLAFMVAGIAALAILLIIFPISVFVDVWVSIRWLIWRK